MRKLDSTLAFLKSFTVSPAMVKITTKKTSRGGGSSGMNAVID
jgi:hypothetical protein